MRNCFWCEGRGTVPDYIGLEMFCIEVECENCNGTGQTKMIQKTEFSRTYVLDQMHKLLSGKNAWTQHSLARNSEGAAVVPESKDAVSFDVIGALYHIEYKNQSPSNIRIGREVRDALAKALNMLKPEPPKSLSDMVSRDNFTHHMNKYNDATGRSQMEILRLIEKAKEL